MSRSRFMLMVGAFHLFFGAFFVLFSRLAIYLFLDEPGPSSLVIVRGLSGICFAFGLMNLMARKSADDPALTAVLVGTLFYLLFTTGCDIWWLQAGVLKPLTWASIVLRLSFACGYAYQLVRRADG